MVVDQRILQPLEEVDLTELPNFVGLTKIARQADRSGQTISHWIAEGRITPTAWLDGSTPIWSKEDAELLLAEVAEGRPPEKHIVSNMPQPKAKLKRKE